MRISSLTVVSLLALVPSALAAQDARPWGAGVLFMDNQSPPNGVEVDVRYSFDGDGVAIPVPLDAGTSGAESSPPDTSVLFLAFVVRKRFSRLW